LSRLLTHLDRTTGRASGLNQRPKS